MYLFRKNLEAQKAVNINVPRKRRMMCLNESTLDPFEAIKDKIIDKMKDVHLNRYFNDVTGQLYAKLAEYAEVEEDQLVFGNGVDEMLYYLFTAVRESSESFAVSFSPSYFDYKSYCNAVGLTIKHVNLDENYANDIDAFLEIAADDNCKLLILCNPNNPTGQLLTEEQVLRILNNTDKLVLIDETYFEFSKVTYKNLISKYSNLIITRSFSKAFSAAGLRFGYLISNADNIVQLKKVMTAFNIGLMTQTIALCILEERHIFLAHTAEVIKFRNEVYARLKKIPQLKVVNTHTNFLLLSLADKTKQLFDFLQENDIALRDVGAHPIMKNHIRVTISSKEDNDIFVQKVNEFVREKC